MATSPPIPDRDVLVVFATRNGATRGVAERIVTRLHERGLTVSLRSVDDVGDIPPGAALVLGSPVYDGRWPPEFESFVDRHLATLGSRPVWLFSVGTFGDT